MGVHRYPKDIRLKIGKEIYDRKLTKFTAAEKYSINPYTARDYLREYKATLNIEPNIPTYQDQMQLQSPSGDHSDYDVMSRDELLKRSTTK